MGLRSAESSSSGPEQLCRALMEHGNNLIYELDTHNSIVRVSRFAAHRIGHPADRLVGSDFAELVHAEDRAAVRQALAAAGSGAAQPALQHRVLNHDGTVRRYTSVVTPVLNERGDVSSYLVNAFELTEHGNTEHGGTEYGGTGHGGTGRRRAPELQLMRRNRFQEILTEIASAFIDLPPERTHETRAASLARVSRSLGAVRSYIYEFRHETDTLERIHYWPGDHAASVTPPSVAPPATLSVNSFSTTTRELQQGRTVQIERDQTAELHRELEALGPSPSVASVRIVPLTDANYRSEHDGRTHCVGFLGIELDRRRIDWSDDEEHLLTAFARMLFAIHRRAVIRDELERSRRFLADLIEHSASIITVKSLEGRYARVNRAFEEYFDLDRDKVLGRTAADLFPGEMAEKIMAMDRSVIETERAQQHEVTIELADGAHHFLTNVFPVRDYAGAVVGTCAIPAEITQQKEAEQERIALETAAEANRAKAAFLANISHEVRTPLNAVVGFLQILARDSELKPQQAEYLRIVNRNAKHLITLVNDILDFSRIESGTVSNRARVFRLDETLNDLHAIFKRTAELKGLQFSVELDDAVPRLIVADEHIIRQVLVNLIGNACKFTTKGYVTLQVGLLPGSRLAIAVSDTGPGIPKHEQSHLFTAFAQARTGAASGGTGLGLAIAKQLVELAGGEITLQSGDGIGSTFRFTIPFRETDEEAIAPERSEARPMVIARPQGPWRVLAVDDNLDSLRMLTAVLEPVGFEVFTAQDAEEAVWSAVQHTPHVVVIDMRLAGTDGTTVTYTIKSTPETRATPVIAISATAFAERNAGNGLEVFAEVITKPFQLSELFQALARVLGLEYHYREPHELEFEPQGAHSLAPSDLATIHSAMLAELREALLSGDIIEFKRLVLQAESVNDEVRRQLIALAEEFNMRMLREVFEV